VFDDFFKTAACLKIRKRIDEIKKPRIVSQHIISFNCRFKTQYKGTKECKKRKTISQEQMK